MRPLLLTSDLHFTPKYFRWLAEQADEFQAVAIAGDLCDFFLAGEAITDELLIERGRTRETSERISVSDQWQRVEGWLAEIGAKTTVCVSSGNHDCGVWRPKIGGVHGDLTVCETESFVIASAPWASGEQPRVDAIFSATEDVLAEASKRSHKTRKPLFILHHEPPSRETLNGKHIVEILKKHRPAFLGCGHLHHDPYLHGWFTREGSTCCFNAGNHEAITGDEFSAPNHILVFPPDAGGESRAEWHHLTLDGTGAFAWEISGTTVKTAGAGSNVRGGGR
jgi:Icc-related predicted phosphoesterase